MEDYCKNCGALIKENSRFCHECGSPIEQKAAQKTETRFCENCGTELGANEEFCPACGHKKRHSLASIPQAPGKDRKLMYALIAVVAVLAIAILLVAGGVFHSEVPLVTEDFGICTMLIPEGSNFVETSSLPDYGFGGYFGMENTGAYSDEVFSIMISTIQGGSYPSGTTIDRQEGDITVYKDTQDKDVYYIERDVGEYEFTVIGNDDEAIIKMLNSIEITD